MAIIASIADPERGREVGTRHPEAVIVALVDHHERARRHVAGDAVGRGTHVFVVRMGRLRIASGVALQTDLVAGEPQFGAVRVMAVAAGHAGGEHLALFERAVIIDLAELLAVRLEKTAGQ